MGEQPTIILGLYCLEFGATFVYYSVPGKRAAYSRLGNNTYLDTAEGLASEAQDIIFPVLD